jgi:tetratricopeptide (TPR) repeat protein
MNQDMSNLCDLSEVDRLSRLAQWREDQGDYRLAAAWLQRALTLKLLDQNIDPVEIAADYFNLGLLFFAEGDEVNAERYLLKALQRQKYMLGPQHTDTLETIETLRSLSLVQDVYAYVQAPHLIVQEESDNQVYFVPERRRIRHAS